MSRLVHVEHGDSANAVGAAIAQVSGECDQIFKDKSRRDMPLAYLPGNSVRVRVVGDVAAS
jgi:hypothetical protein